LDQSVREEKFAIGLLSNILIDQLGRWEMRATPEAAGVLSPAALMDLRQTGQS